MTGAVISPAVNQTWRLTLCIQQDQGFALRQQEPDPLLIAFGRQVRRDEIPHRPFDGSRRGLVASMPHRSCTGGTQVWQLRPPSCGPNFPARLRAPRSCNKNAHACKKQYDSGSKQTANDRTAMRVLCTFALPSSALVGLFPCPEFACSALPCSRRELCLK